jgi:hypothetical protein
MGAMVAQAEIRLSNDGKKSKGKGGFDPVVSFERVLS